MKEINKNFLFRVSLLMFLVGIVLFPANTEASSVTLDKSFIEAEVGSTFTLPVSIDPLGEKQYTARLNLSFPADLLEVTSFIFKPSWLSISQPGYDLINNNTGELIKTAGFPNGFLSATSFGTVTFRVKSSGEGYIIVGPKSVVLNATSKDTLTSRPQIKVTVSKATKAPPSQKASSVSSVEPNLFDVSSIDASSAPQVLTSGEGLVSRVAPGEFLVFSVKLLNFGNRNKVDVNLSYDITDSGGKVIHHAGETVAVETTATFVKTIQIPFGTPPGQYKVNTSITYKDQVVPANTGFTFMVESKILGLFKRDFTVYGGSTFVISLLAVFGYILSRRYRQSRFSPLSYSSVPRDTRIFYEILSDTIMGMRQRVGNEALTIASLIDGLQIDKETGRVIALTKSPSQIIANLVSQYEKRLGQKVSFSFIRDKAVY